MGDVTFTVSVANNLITFFGVNSDDSLRIHITYNPQTNKFDYTQTLFIDDQNNILQSGPGFRVSARITYSDVSIDPANHYFNTYGHAIGLFETPDGTTTGMQLFETQEFYYGVLHDYVKGTGNSVYEGYEAYGSDFTLFPQTSVNAPQQVSDFSNLDLMEAYYDETSFADFRGSLSPKTFSQIWSNDGQSITELTVADSSSISKLLESYPATWGINSIRNNP